MSKYQFTASDIYLPGTDIPKNHLGIAEPELLHEVEETMLQQAYQTFITECETSTRFDESYFKALHQRTFESLYDWAGVYRTVDMSKGSSLFVALLTLSKNRGESSSNWNKKTSCNIVKISNRKNLQIAWLTINPN